MAEDELLARVSAAICEARNRWFARDLEGDQPDFDDELARAALDAVGANAGAEIEDVRATVLRVMKGNKMATDADLAILIANAVGANAGAEIDDVRATVLRVMKGNKMATDADLAILIANAVGAAVRADETSDEKSADTSNT